MANESHSGNRRAVAFAQQMLARKKAIEKEMVEGYSHDTDAQAAVAKLHEALKEEKLKKHGAVTV